MPLSKLRHRFSFLQSLQCLSITRRNVKTPPNEAPLNEAPLHEAPPNEAKAASTMPTKNPKQVQSFAFLRLPIEIRNKVYELTLTSSQVVHIRAVMVTGSRTYLMLSETTGYYDYLTGSDDHVRGWDARDAYSINMEEVKFQAWPPRHLLGWTPGLTLTSRQLHVETNAMLYGANVFNFTDWKEFHCFRSISGQQCIVLLQHLELPFPIPEWPRGFNHRASITRGRPPKWAGEELQNLNRNGSLKTLTFTLRCNLTEPVFIASWRYILRGIPESCKVTIRCSEQYYDDLTGGFLGYRCIKLDKGVFSAFMERKWNLTGRFIMKKWLLDDDKTPSREDLWVTMGDTYLESLAHKLKFNFSEPDLLYDSTTMYRENG